MGASRSGRWRCRSADGEVLRGAGLFGTNLYRVLNVLAARCAVADTKIISSGVFFCHLLQRRDRCDDGPQLLPFFVTRTTTRAWRRAAAAVGRAAT